MKKGEARSNNGRKNKDIRRSSVCEVPRLQVVEELSANILRTFQESSKNLPKRFVSKIFRIFRKIVLVEEEGEGGRRGPFGSFGFFGPCTRPPPKRKQNQCFFALLGQTLLQDKSEKPVHNQ